MEQKLTKNLEYYFKIELLVNLSEPTCGLESQCKCGRIIPASFKCDAENDCGNYPDESGWSNVKRTLCPFLCKNNKCIPNAITRRMAETAVTKEIFVQDLVIAYLKRGFGNRYFYSHGHQRMRNSRSLFSTLSQHEMIVYQF